MKPDLRLLLLSSIEHQEFGDPPRVARLVEQLKKSGVVYDPIIVTRGIHRAYMQIDGITRICALKELGCSHIVAQYVDYLDPAQVAIKSWAHVSRVNQSLFLQKIKQRFAGKTESFKLGLGVTLVGHPLAAATVIFRNGKGLSITSGGDIVKAANVTNQMVQLYGSFIERDHQVTIDSMAQLSEFFNNHPTTNVALFFSNYQPSELYKLMRLHMSLPQGLTRHIIAGRVLGIRYPIDQLMKSVPIREKEKAFTVFKKNMRLRFYEESVHMVE